MRRGRDRAGGDAGSVTVELALAMPSVVLLLGFVMAGGTWLRAEIVATQAATTAARLAITEGLDAGAAAAERISGGTAVVKQEGGSGWIVATVVVGGVGPMPDAQATARVPGQP